MFTSVTAHKLSSKVRKCQYVKMNVHEGDIMASSQSTGKKYGRYDGTGREDELKERTLSGLFPC